MKDEISGRQVCLLALLSLLSPAVRVLPGDGPWYAPLLGLPAGLGYGLLLLRRGGPRGRLWPLLAALWLSLCAGFVVRDASERLTAAVYPDREAWGFVALTLLAALPLAAGKLTTLGRLGELSAPVLGLGLVIAGGFLLTEVKLSHLLPLPAAGAGELLRGGLKAAELGALPGVFLFLRRKEEAGFQKLYLATIFILFLLFISISALTVGTLGSYLTGQLANPLLTAVRN
ncbi:MAG: GerAB/ArcD/ProY family transporter, partial [bacterium]